MCWAWLPLLALLFPDQVGAPVPCSFTTQADVEVGGIVKKINPSRTLLHAESEERDCAFVTDAYEGQIIITCDEGGLNVTAEGCFPRRCQPWMSITVRLGELSVGASPLEIIASGEHEVRLCRNLNPLFRGKYIMFCNFGLLSIDAADCVTQWDPMNLPPWAQRSRHTAVGLSDGAFLMLGGLGSAGPLREVWQWTPIPGSMEGNWEETLKIPPWSGRFGLAAVRQTKSEGEQVLIMGGNDNQNRRDTWRWLRDPAHIKLLLEDSEPIGTQARGCSLPIGGSLTCYANEGVSGRKWHISHYLEMSTEIFIDILYDAGPKGIPPGAAGVGAAVFAIYLDSCRQIFRAEGGSWSTTGCTGEEPPWSRWEEPAVRLGPSGAAYPGQPRQLRFFFDREQQQVVLYSDNVPMVPLGAPPGQLGFSIGGGACGTYSLDDNNETGVCTSKPPVTNMFLRAIEAVVWPEARLEVKSLSVTSPAGYWQPLISDAPWSARSAHAAVALPDGDILLMGGVGEAGLLNDVWRWSPKKCTLMEMADVEAAAFALECIFSCKDSPIYGQWTQLMNAPWAPRMEHAAVWTATGVLLMGGRTQQGFENDVWKWSYSGEFCSLDWQGAWVQISPAVAWMPRHGHSVVAFTRPGEDAVETVLIIGGFGGLPYSDKVIRGQEQVQSDRQQPRNDIWCGNQDLDNFGTWTEIAPTAPWSSRAQLAAVIAPTVGDFSMIIFGGYDENSRLTLDQWRWSGENNTFECKVDVLGE
eukprot:TRINITY_DN62242_c0_g1_i1.p1 TRINITY_DN62242_c0_g1~~TRINITY_DN62242_c0_g1_i1.p1  ORF type:complete len:767 (+),score=128.24 TRINITY_DN62242_c0_g1_i1:48-2303(+)